MAENYGGITNLEFRNIDVRGFEYRYMGTPNVMRIFPLAFTDPLGSNMALSGSGSWIKYDFPSGRFIDAGGGPFLKFQPNMAPQRC